jgi:plasmid stability protein
MCQMCDEYEAELIRMGIAMDEKVTIELDSEALDTLAHRAEAHGHDVATEARAIILERITTSPKETDWLARARQIRAMTPPGSIAVDTWKLIRASRDWDH